MGHESDPAHIFTKFQGSSGSRKFCSSWWYREYCCHRLDPYRILQAGKWRTYLRWHPRFLFSNKWEIIQMLSPHQGSFYADKQEAGQQCSKTRANEILAKQMNFNVWCRFPYPKDDKIKDMPCSVSIYWNTPISYFTNYLANSGIWSWAWSWHPKSCGSPEIWVPNCVQPNRQRIG